MRYWFLAFALLLAGCSGMKIENFKGREPKLDLVEFFTGKSTAWGVFEDRFGNLRRTFVVEIDGSWDGEKLTLVEDFTYDDGEKQQRIWVITPDGKGNYSGTAGDVVGVANGRSEGNALFWSYEMDLKVGDGLWRVRFDDWMWRMDADTLINRARVYRWGLEIGEVSIFFRRG